MYQTNHSTYLTVHHSIHSKDHTTPCTPQVMINHHHTSHSHKLQHLYLTYITNEYAVYSNVTLEAYLNPLHMYLVNGSLYVEGKHATRKVANIAEKVSMGYLYEACVNNCCTEE